MQRDRHAGIDAVQVVEHLHVEREITNRNGPVFRLYEIEADNARVGTGELETGENLGEHGFTNAGPCDLEDVAKRDGATGLCVGGAAAQQFPPSRLGTVQSLASFGDNGVAESGGQQLVAQLSEIGIPSGLNA